MNDFKNLDYVEKFIFIEFLWISVMCYYCKIIDVIWNDLRMIDNYDVICFGFFFKLNVVIILVDL